MAEQGDLQIVLGGFTVPNLVRKTKLRDKRFDHLGHT
jgi:hypothetical protein